MNSDAYEKVLRQLEKMAVGTYSNSDNYLYQPEIRVQASGLLLEHHRWNVERDDAAEREAAERLDRGRR